ncbi:hypothetical protein C8Q78DRAFT_32139 [Trametes maxima]|nr:hypothetical protein C8Q78DRAFT_32139 [Trametes maxima]
MSAIAAHYASAAAASDRRYADLAAHYADPSAFFHYHQPSLTAVTASLDGAYAFSAPAASSTASYSAWDAHESAVPSPSYSASSISSASANPYSSSSAAPTAHPSVTASFSYSGQTDYSAPSHRSFPSRSTHHHTLPSSSSSSHAASTGSTSGRGKSYSSGARPYSTLTAATAASTTPGTSSSSTPRLQNASWDNSSLYTIEPSDPVASTSSQHAYSHSSVSSPLTTPATPPIKEEDPEGGFIIEVSVPAEPVVSSMPEVPLRATHAPPKMRKMMCTFRLENFAIHDGIRSAATQPGPGGIEVGPLRDPPEEFEWQIQLTVPLIPEEDEAFQYAATQAKSHAYSAYRDLTPASPRAARGHTTASPRRTCPGFSVATSASPPLSLEYPTTQMENEAWDGSSGYGDNASGSTTATSTASPTFTSIMTPAQSLGWSMRYHTSEADVDSSSNYQRHSVVQPSLSRVSQAQSRYTFGGSNGAKTSYHASQQQQQAQYAYDSGGYSRSSASSGRYPAEVYASSGSSTTWPYRS